MTRNPVVAGRGRSGAAEKLKVRGSENESRKRDNPDFQSPRLRT